MNLVDSEFAGGGQNQSLTGSEGISENGDPAQAAEKGSARPAGLFYSRASTLLDVCMVSIASGMACSESEALPGQQR